MQNPRRSHMNVVKYILRYVQGTHNYGIIFPRRNEGVEMRMTPYFDAYWYGDKCDRKSTTGYLFFLENSPILWSSTKEPTVALSSCEAKYITSYEATCQAIWLKSVMEGLKIVLAGMVQLCIDNKSAIYLAIYLVKHPASYGRSKHIETIFYYIRDQVKNERLELCHCKSKVQLDDILTKALKFERFKNLRKLIGVTSVI